MSPSQIIEQIKPGCSWVNTYGLLVDLCKEVDAKSLIEVGVAYGFHAEYVLTHLPSISYTGIDPYKAHYDSSDCFATDVFAAFKGANEQEAMDSLYEGVKENLSKHSNANLLRGTFQDVSSAFEDDSVDVIFIDGDHTYEGVLLDLQIALEKVNKKKGIICGDDIHWSGVMKACNDFFHSRNLSYTVEEKNGGKFFVSRFVS